MCQNRLFLVEKIQIFEFSRLNWSKIVISWFFRGNFYVKIANFEPKSFDIWYILESEIQEFYTILAQKFKIGWFVRFCQNSIFEQKYEFLHSVCGEVLFKLSMLTLQWCKGMSDNSLKKSSFFVMLTTTCICKDFKNLFME